MSKCYNCGTEFTLIEGEIRCDNCKKIVNFPCHNCKQWFSIENKKQCKSCGYFTCPNCLTCGSDCPKNDWAEMIKEIVVMTDEQLKKLIELIEDIKIGKERKNCPHGVSISYAKSRIKSCVARLKGFRIKNQIDLEKFKERVNQTLDKNLGEELRVSQSREAGSYGQEWRDVFNYLVCEGKLIHQWKTFKEGEKEIKYEVFIRCEKSTCPMLDMKGLIIKQCPKCLKVYDLSQISCCIYKKGIKKGQPFKLKEKVSNKDICQLSRGDFKKEEDGENKY